MYKDPLYATRILPDGRRVHGAASAMHWFRQEGGPTMAMMNFAMAWVAQRDAAHGTLSALPALTTGIETTTRLQ